MKIGKIDNSPKFGNVYGICGSMEQIVGFYDEVIKARQSVGNLLFIPATDVFVSSKINNENEENILTKAVKAGKEVAMLITGEDYQKITNRKRGWKTKKDIGDHIQEVLELDKITEKQKQAITKTIKG